MPQHPSGDDPAMVFAYWTNTMQLSGSQLQDKVWERFALNHGELLTKPYYIKQQQVFVRHPLNDRRQADTLERYTKNILKDGVLKGVRSDVWTIAADPTSKFPEQQFTVSGMTLLEAAYLAEEREPENSQVCWHGGRAHEWGRACLCLAGTSCWRASRVESCRACPLVPATTGLCKVWPRVKSVCQ